ncbi:MAG: hypothetical protein JXA14_09890 [Anaerolineae bacterium]|nr:hypothetical protein [Anaerolineae bacterium]
MISLNASGVNSPVAGAPELRPGALNAELDSEDGAFTPPSGGGAPAPLHPQGQTPPQGAGLLPGVNISIHDIIGGNVERLDALLDIFVDLFPRYAHTLPRLHHKGQSPADANPRFIAHQWLVDIDHQAAGMVSFKYSPDRNLGLTVYIGIRPAYRQIRVKSSRLSEWLIASSIDQLQTDARATGRPTPTGMFLEVEPPRLVARYCEFGFIELPVEYFEPRFRQPRVGFGCPDDLSQVDFCRTHLGGFPLQSDISDPTDPTMLADVILAFMVDHYGLPIEHWAVQRALHSIQALPENQSGET